MAKKEYRVYVTDAAKWTLDDEKAYDYVLLDGDNIFFISSKNLTGYEEAEYIPAKVASWLAECEAMLVKAKYERKVKRAVKKLEEDFKENLDKMLAMQEEELTEEG